MSAMLHLLQRASCVNRATNTAAQYRELPRSVWRAASSAFSDTVGGSRRHSVSVQSVVAAASHSMYVSAVKTTTRTSTTVSTNTGSTTQHQHMVADAAASESHADVFAGTAADALLTEYAQESPLSAAADSSQVARLSHVFHNTDALGAHLRAVLAMQSEQHRRQEFRATMLTAHRLRTPFIEDVFRSYSGNMQPLVSDYSLMIHYAIHVSHSFEWARRAFTDVQKLPGFEPRNEPRLLSLMLEALSTLARDHDAVIKLYERQRAAGIRLALHNYPAVVTALLRKNRFSDAIRLFQKIATLQLDANWRSTMRPRLLLAVTRGLAVAGQVHQGWQFLTDVNSSMRAALRDERLPVFVFTPILWGMAISGPVENISPRERLMSALDSMKNEFGVEPDVQALAPFLQSLTGNARDLSLAVRIFSQAIDARLIDPAAMAILFHGLARAGQIEEAIRLFNRAFRDAPELLAESSRAESKRFFFNIFHPTFRTPGSLVLPDTSLDTIRQHQFYHQLFSTDPNIKLARQLHADTQKRNSVQQSSAAPQHVPFLQFLHAAIARAGAEAASLQAAIPQGATPTSPTADQFAKHLRIRLPMSGVLLRVIIDGCIACNAASLAIRVLEQTLPSRNAMKMLQCLDSRFLSRFVASLALQTSSGRVDSKLASTGTRTKGPQSAPDLPDPRMHRCERKIIDRLDCIRELRKSNPNCIVLPDRDGSAAASSQNDDDDVDDYGGSDDLTGGQAGKRDDMAHVVRASDVFLADSIYNLMIQGYCLRGDIHRAALWLQRLQQDRARSSADESFLAVLSARTLAALMQLLLERGLPSAVLHLESLVLSEAVVSAFERDVRKTEGQLPDSSAEPLVSRSQHRGDRFSFLELLSAIGQCVSARVALGHLLEGLHVLRAYITTAHDTRGKAEQSELTRRDAFGHAVKKAIKYCSPATADAWYQTALVWQSSSAPPHERGNRAIRDDGRLTLMANYLWHLPGIAQSVPLRSDPRRFVQSRVAAYESAVEQVLRLHSISTLMRPAQTGNVLAIVARARHEVQPSKRAHDSLDGTLDALLSQAKMSATLASADDSSGGGGGGGGGSDGGERGNERHVSAASAERTMRIVSVDSHLAVADPPPTLPSPPENLQFQCVAGGPAAADAPPLLSDVNLPRVLTGFYANADALPSSALLKWRHVRAMQNLGLLNGHVRPLRAGAHSSNAADFVPGFADDIAVSTEWASPADLATGDESVDRHVRIAGSDWWRTVGGDKLPVRSRATASNKHGDEEESWTSMYADAFSESTPAPVLVMAAARSAASPAASTQAVVRTATVERVSVSTAAPAGVTTRASAAVTETAETITAVQAEATATSISSTASLPATTACIIASEVDRALGAELSPTRSFDLSAFAPLLQELSSGKWFASDTLLALPAVSAARARMAAAVGLNAEQAAGATAQKLLLVLKERGILSIRYRSQSRRGIKEHAVRLAREPPTDVALELQAVLRRKL